jgi:hypothetical protein
MDENPYEAPKVAGGGSERDLTSKLTSLRLVLAFLVSVVAFQWVCHFLTATAMFSYMEAARVGPTAKTLDSAFYGFCCVGFTAILSLAAGIVGMRALKRNDANPKGP